MSQDTPNIHTPITQEQADQIISLLGEILAELRAPEERERARRSALLGFYENGHYKSLVGTA